MKNFLSDIYKLSITAYVFAAHPEREMNPKSGGPRSFFTCTRNGLPFPVGSRNGLAICCAYACRAVPCVGLHVAPCCALQLCVPCVSYELCIALHAYRMRVCCLLPTVTATCDLRSATVIVCCGCACRTASRVRISSLAFTKPTRSVSDYIYVTNKN